MYYQVGNQCLEQQQAENVYFGLVVPVLTQEGQIIKPEHNGTAWQLNGQIIQANLPVSTHSRPKAAGQYPA